MATRSSVKDVSEQKQRIFSFDWYRTLPEQAAHAFWDLAELYPSRARGAGQGFTYNFGRAVGAFFPAMVGFLSVSIGLAGAVAFGALAYGLCLVALIFLPETKGKAFVALD